MKTLSCVTVTAAALSLHCLTLAMPCAAQGPDADLAEAPPKIEFEAQTGLVRIGAVTIDPARRQIRFPAQVNMDEGLLEYAVVGDRGKLHESLFHTLAEPLDLQVSLLLLGLRGRGDLGQPPEPAAAPRGDALQVWIEWRSDPAGAARRTRLEDWILDARTKASMPPVDWVFTGSWVQDGTFMAQLERSIIAIYRDGLAMIENPLPEASDDTIWFVNKGAVPVPGTVVDVVLQAGASGGSDRSDRSVGSVGSTSPPPLPER